MKDAYEVLYQKEADLARVRQEVESLTLAASLLADDHLSYFVPEATTEVPGKKPAEKEASAPAAEATGTEALYPLYPRRGFWESLTGRRG